jgi:hypothetical protein
MRLAFVHTPRTGGTTITQELAKQGSVLSINGRAGVRDFLMRDPDERRSFDFAAGHMPFGIEQHVPGVPVVVFLRNPQERVLPSYRQARSNPDHPHHKIFQEMSFADYLRSDLFLRDDPMVRFFARRDWSEALGDGPIWWERLPLGRVSTRLLHEAKENLKRCAFIGFTESFQESATSLFEMFRLSAVQPWPKENSNPESPQIGDLGPDALVLLRRRLELDLELYDFARTLTP